MFLVITSFGEALKRRVLQLFSGTSIYSPISAWSRKNISTVWIHIAYIKNSEYFCYRLTIKPNWLENCSIRNFKIFYNISAMKIFGIIKSHPANSLGWKVLIKFTNTVLWIGLSDVLLLIALSSSESLWKTIIASLCTIGIVFDMFWLNSIDAPLISSINTHHTNRDYIQADIDAASHPGNISLKDLM